MCGISTKEKLTFYKDKYDKSDKADHKDIIDKNAKVSKNNKFDDTLGNFLKNLYKKGSELCEHCREPMFKHYI